MNGYFTEDEIDHALSFYSENGWLVLKGFLSMEMVGIARERLVVLAKEAKSRPELEPEFETSDASCVRKLRRLAWGDSVFWRRLVRKARYFSLAKHIVKTGRPTLIFHAAFLKPARLGSAIALHQDEGLWRHKYDDAVTIWTALADCTEENGAVHVFSGSHAAGLMEHRELPDYKWHRAIPREAVDSSSESILVMEPGDVAIWHKRLIHGSGPSLSPKDRTSMVMVFAARSEKFEASDQYSE